MSKERDQIPDTPRGYLPYKHPEDNPGRNLHSDAEKVVRTNSAMKHNPTVKSGGKGGKR